MLLTSINNYLYSLVNNYTIPITIIIVLLIDRLKYYSKSSIIAAWTINIIGTFFHELMHLIVSFITFGKPTKISLFPKKDGNEYVLGYVQSSNIRWFNAFPIAMAPLLLLVIAYYFDKWYFTIVTVNSVWLYFLYIFIIITLIDSSIPSTQDFKVAFSNYSFIFYLLLFICIYIIFQYKSLFWRLI